MGKKKKLVPPIYEDTRVQAERLAHPKAVIESVRRTEPVNTSKSALEVLAGIIKDTHKGRDTTNARDQYIFDRARNKVPYSELARQLKMPIEEVQRIHIERLKAEYAASPEEMRMVLIDQVSALQERLWSMAEDMGMGTDTARLLLSSVKVLQDLYNLAKKDATVTINLINHQQSVLMIGAVNVAMEHVLNAPELDGVLTDTRRKQIIEGALISAADTVQSAQDEVIVLG